MSTSEIPRISCEKLKERIDNGENVVIIDTRAAIAYRDEHIAGAINIPLDTSGDPFGRQMTYMALPADRPVVVYCDCANESESLVMADEIKNQRYEIEDIGVLEEGILRWRLLEYPTEKSSS